MSEETAVDPEFRDARADLAERTRGLLAAADEEVTRCRRIEEALLAQLAAARDDRRRAVAEQMALRRAAAAFEGSAPFTGRPRGSTKPSGTRERVKALLPTRAEWRGSHLVEALAAQGHEVTGNQVSAALAALAKSGDAYRVRSGWWATARGPDDPSGEVTR